MKLTKRDISVLLYVTAIAALFLVYQLYYTPTMTDTEAVLAECQELEKDVAELTARVEQQPVIEADIKQKEQKIDDVLKLYPSSISEEDIIMYVKELNDELDMKINGVSFTAPSPIYSVVGSGYAEKYNFICESITININYSTDYDGLKKIVNYINEDKDHRILNSVSIGISAVDDSNDSNVEMVLNEDGEFEPVKPDTITGNMSLNLYLIDNKPVKLDADGNPVIDEEDDRFNIPEVDHGIDDIFRTDGTTGGSMVEKEEESSSAEN